MSIVALSVHRLKKIKTSVDGRHTFKKPVTYASAGHLILVSTLVMVSREEASGCIDAAFKFAIVVSLE